jgi:hypothetical protein
MQVLDDRWAGIAIPKQTVVAPILWTLADGKTTKTTRTFGTMTAELLDLAAWLDHEQIEPVAIERSGVYWWPV